MMNDDEYKNAAKLGRELCIRRRKQHNQNSQSMYYKNEILDI